MPRDTDPPYLDKLNDCDYPDLNHPLDQNIYFKVISFFKSEKWMTQEQIDEVENLKKQKCPLKSTRMVVIACLEIFKRNLRYNEVTLEEADLFSERYRLETHQLMDLYRENHLLQDELNKALSTEPRDDKIIDLYSNLLNKQHFKIERKGVQLKKLKLFFEKG